jgi:hypothetical protein
MSPPFAKLSENTIIGILVRTVLVADLVALWIVFVG